MCLSKHQINVAYNKQDLTSNVLDSKNAWKPIIASPVCSIKPLSKDITPIFKLFYEKVEWYHTKGKVWLGIITFWTIRIATL